MAWKKNSPEAVERFDEHVAVPGARRNVMFGCPIYLLRGQRYASLHQDRVVLRLSQGCRPVDLGRRAAVRAVQRETREGPRYGPGVHRGEPAIAPGVGAEGGSARAHCKADVIVATARGAGPNAAGGLDCSRAG
jgi:hypothetical protein